MPYVRAWRLAVIPAQSCTEAQTAYTYQEKSLNFGSEFRSLGSIEPIVPPEHIGATIRVLIGLRVGLVLKDEITNDQNSMHCFNSFII